MTYKLSNGNGWAKFFGEQFEIRKLGLTKHVFLNFFWLLGTVSPRLTRDGPKAVLGLRNFVCGGREIPNPL